MVPRGDAPYQRWMKYMIPSSIHTMFRLLLSFPLSRGLESSPPCLQALKNTLNPFFLVLILFFWIFTVIHHHHTRVCSVIHNYLIAIFRMQFSGGCMIGWWCQGQVRKQQYFQRGEGGVATFLSNPFNQLRHSSHCLHFHHNLENRATESVIRSAKCFGWICEKKLHFGIDWFSFWRHSQQLGKAIGALICESSIPFAFSPRRFTIPTIIHSWRAHNLWNLLFEIYFGAIANNWGTYRRFDCEFSILFAFFSPRKFTIPITIHRLECTQSVESAIWDLFWRHGQQFGWAPVFSCFGNVAVIRKFKLYISWSAQSVEICKEEGRNKLLFGIYSHSHSQLWSKGCAGFEFSMRSPINFVASDFRFLAA